MHKLKSNIYSECNLQTQKQLSKNVFYQRNLWDASTHCWNDWRYIAHNIFLSFVYLHTIMDSISLISHEDIFKIKLDILSPFACDWEWIFRGFLVQYYSERLFSLAHQRHGAKLFLHSRCFPTSTKRWWMNRLCNVSSHQLKYKL